MKISVLGLGHVGLPRSLQFVRSGAEILGLDVNQLQEWSPLLVDIRNAMAAVPCRPGQVWKA
ncbi:MAG: hypothetical protein IT578_02000 [Verrucomicrobiae bacterium]|nr:hypothetical protein [Verrucomicrobiae bacterium]